MKFRNREEAELYLQRLGFKEERFCLWFASSPLHRGTMAEIYYANGSQNINLWRLDGRA